MFSTLKLGVVILVDRIFPVIIVWRMEMVREGRVTVVFVCGHLLLQQLSIKSFIYKEGNDTVSSEMKIREVLVVDYILRAVESAAWGTYGCAKS